MRILFFTHYYPPEVNAPASRTSEHCRVWVEQGHEVTVVTCAPNHPHGTLYPGYRNRWFQVEEVDGVRVVRVWSYLAANEGFVRRILNYLSYMFAALAAVPRLARPDLVVSTSPQFFCGLTGFFASAMKRVPWVLEIRDLWPESIVSVGAMKKGRVVRILEWLERFAYRRADHVISVTDSFVPHIAERRGRPGISVLKNGVDLTRFVRSTDADAAERVKQEFGLGGRFVAAYVGTHGMAHGLDTVLDAAALLRDDPRIGFLLVGDGAERKRLEERKQALGLDNLHIAGQRPKADMPGIWAATDASLVVLRKSDTFKKVLPSKMFEAMAMARPIVLSVEGEARALLEEAGAGVFTPPEDAEALARTITGLVEDGEKARSLAESGFEFVRREYDRRKIALRYAALLERCVAGTPPETPQDTPLAPEDTSETTSQSAAGAERL